MTAEATSKIRLVFKGGGLSGDTAESDFGSLSYWTPLVSKRTGERYVAKERVIAEDGVMEWWMRPEVEV